MNKKQLSLAIFTNYYELAINSIDRYEDVETCRKYKYIKQLKDTIKEALILQAQDSLFVSENSEENEILYDCLEFDKKIDYELIYRFCLSKISDIRKFEKEKGIYKEGFALSFEKRMFKGKLKKGEIARWLH